MITAIRRIVTSRVGAIVALMFLVLIGLAFALSDVSNLGLSSSSVGSGNVARVGKETITINELRRRLDSGLRQAQTEQPGLTMQQFVAQGGLDRIVKELADISALEQYGRALGIGMSPAAVDAIIARDPAFSGLTGAFDQKVFEQQIASQGMTARDLRQRIAASGIVRQLLAPIGQIPAIPQGMTARYASLLLEERQGQAAFLPASQFAPDRAPTNAEIATFFNGSRARYAIPERRVIRYALIDESSVPAQQAVSPAEIQAEYRANAARYAASETRQFQQVIASTRATADRIAAEARTRGVRAAAAAAGLQASSVTGTSESQFAGTTTPALARSAYSAARGGIVGPVEVPLGFMVLQVEGIESSPARTLAQATPEITASLTARKRREALDTLYNSAQDALNGGATVSEVAQDKGLRLVTTPAILPDGRAPEAPTWQPGPFLENILRAAFDSSPGDPGQIIQAGGEDVFAIVEVADFIAAAPPPLASIRERVVADWRRVEGARAARARARQILAAVEGGQPLAAAATAAGAGASVQTIGGRRMGAADSQGRLPPEVALLFSMARGTAKTLELPGNSGWMVIQLTEARRGDASQNPDLVAAVQGQLGQALGGEYVELVVRAARERFPVTIDAAAVEQLRRDLTGAGAPAVS